MPYKRYKIRGKDLYKVINTETKEVKSEGSTLEDAKKQIRLLNSLEKKEKKGGGSGASKINGKNEEQEDKILKNIEDRKYVIGTDGFEKLNNIIYMLNQGGGEEYISLDNNVKQLLEDYINGKTLISKKLTMIRKILKKYNELSTQTPETDEKPKSKKNKKIDRENEYRDNEAEGGSLKASQIKKAIELSYNIKKEDAPKGYEIDKELSDGRVKVYKDINSPQVLVVHRGSKGTRDWLDNVRYGLTGQTKTTDTFKKHEKKHKKSIKKYCAENIISLGHSRAGMYVQELIYKNPVKEVITYNKASGPYDLFRKNPKNQTDVRTSIDVVSALTPLQSHENKIVTIPSNTLNPLIAHSAEPLGKLGDKLLGSGINIDNLKKMKVAEMKKIIKAFKKANNEKWNSSKVKKNELVDIIKNQILGQSQNKNDNQIHPCWPKYEQYGMKIKNDKQVPNCIPTGGLLEKSEDGLRTFFLKSDDGLLEK